MRKDSVASHAEIMHLAGTLVFLLMSCFDKLARGGLQLFYSWITDNADMSTLWKTKSITRIITPSLRVGLAFFLRAIPMIKPRVYGFGKVALTPIVAYSDAEWTPAVLPLLPGLGLGVCIGVGNNSFACATTTPMEFVNSLAANKTHIIQLEL